MIFYIVVFLVVLALLVFGKKFTINGLNVQGLAYLLIFVLSAFRFDVGWDYITYFNLIEKNIKFYENQLLRLEPFNRVLINFSQDIDFTQFYFITTSFIIVYCIYKTLKRHSSDIVISTLLFLSLPIFFFNSLSIIRQFTAVSLLFFAFRFIQARQLFRFLFVLVIATCFHKSALVALPLYFLYGWRPPFYFYPIIFIFGFFSSDFLYWMVQHLLPQYLRFLDMSVGVGGDKVLLLFQFLGFLLLFFVDQLKRQKNENSFYFLVFFIGLFIWSSLARYGHAGFRGSLYYIVYFLLLAPNILVEFKQRKILNELTYVVCFFFFVLTLYLGKINPKKDPNIPYQTFFNKDKFDLEESK